MAILGHLPMPAIGQAANLVGQKLAAAGGFPRALLGLGGNADGAKLVGIAIDPAGEPHAQSAGIELVGFAFAVEGDGGDEKTLRPDRDELVMENKAKAATLLNGVNDQA